MDKTWINQCENCGMLYPDGWGDLSKVDDLADRIAPGERVPSGQCGECGALVHRREICPLTLQRLALLSLNIQPEEGDNTFTPANVEVSGSGMWLNIRVHTTFHLDMKNDYVSQIIRGEE